MFGLLMDINIAALAAALVAGLTGAVSAVGMALSITKSVDSIARQPEAGGQIRSILLLGLAFLETLAIYGLLVAILLISMK